MDKIWHSSYPSGVPTTVDVHVHSSLADLITQTCTNYGERTAFISMSERLSYQDLLSQAQAFANFLLHELKLAPGTRVALMMPNVLQYPVAMFGVLLADMVVVNVNPLYTDHELNHQLNDSGARVVVVLANMAHTLSQACVGTAVQHVLVTEFADAMPWYKAVFINCIIKYVKRMVPKYELAHALSWRQALRLGQQHPRLEPRARGEHIAFLQYTGGTTGVAKGAVLSHANVLANIAQICAWFKPVLNAQNEYVLTPLPLYHIFSLTCNCLTFMALGATNVLVANPRDLASVVKEFKRHPISIMTAVNTLFNALLHDEGFLGVDFSHLKIAVGGGMPVQKSVADAWYRAVGIPILEGYGLTEASPVVCINPVNLTEYSGSIGLPIPNTDVSLRDEQGNEVALGAEGELYVQGPQVMQGYWQSAPASAAVFDQARWLATGDVAVMDGQGFLRIVDRKKDMILVSGFNVYPTEVEEVIAACPGVLEVGVTGVPSDKTGEKVKAFIVKKDPNLTAEQVKQFCEQHLTRYKLPRDIVFRESLPKSNVGKILRRELK